MQHAEDKSRTNTGWCNRRSQILRAMVVWLVLFSTSGRADDSAKIDFFETQIRPLLIASCVECHGAAKQEGDLRLDSRQALFKGGESGPAIVLKQPQESRLVAAVRRSGDLKMPPEKPLTQQQVDALTRWIELGAPWPESVVLTAAADAPHWAFQPVKDPEVLQVGRADLVRTPIDSFVLAKLETSQLQPSPASDRRTLIRRATFDLLGLPPSVDEVEAFVNDSEPGAWERVIDRLLKSPHYGEKWGRHWLDVARYSDSKGYVYAREERFWVHAWAYRDWVVNAINNDLPFDRFLLLQIAADQMDVPKTDLAAMGFLTVGRRFLGVTHDIIDDRIDVVTRGTMGLTVACARCHDHKYDPIPTRDYYSLYSVFKNCTERLVPLADIADPKSEFASGLAERTKKLDDQMALRRSETADRVRSRLADYLAAQLELDKYPEEGFDQVLVETDIMPEFVRRWRDYLLRAEQNGDRVFAAWRRFRAIPDNQFADRAADICSDLQKPSADIDPRLAAIFVQPPGSIREVAARYGKLFAEVNQHHVQASKQGGDHAGSADPLLRVLYGPDSPCEVPDEPIVNTERFFPSAHCTELWKLSGEVDRWLKDSPDAPPHALILVDRATTTDDRVLVRGDPATPGDVVPRQFMEVVAGSDRAPFQNGSGRLELARAIIDPSNPLTARVAVNRVWMHHFGAGLVPTPSDFGRRAALPSHPELLDWLTSRFVSEGWSLKKLHRLIMLSYVYRQSSFGPADPALLARARSVDPENRMLWRMNTTRLTFEELRDAALAVSGELQPDVGGRSVDLFNSQRRTLYAGVDRQFLPTVLRVFDFANPDLHIPKRNETTVPQQALFFMNHRFLIERSKALAARSNMQGEPTGDVRTASLTDAQRVQDIYRAVLQREATPDQLAAALQLVAAAQEKSETPPPVTEWSYGFGEYEPQQQRLIGFQALPYFSGSAWQGGPQWPDAKLGWVQLTAEGGHAGNDKQHAAVRRWTAPRAMTVSIKSALIHAAQPGDGVRGFVVSSRQGLLKSAEVHLRTEPFDVAALQVEQGETVDFVVDLRENLNHEEYLWTASLTAIEQSGNQTGVSWNSQTDFAGTETAQLDGWEQLAQVLLASNEFLFVD